VSKNYVKIPEICVKIISVKNKKSVLKKFSVKNFSVKNNPPLGDHGVDHYGNCLLATIGYCSCFVFGLFHSYFRDIYTISIRITFATLAFDSSIYTGTQLRKNRHKKT